MVKTRHYILAALAGGHLVLVALGAGEVDLTRFGGIGRALAEYSNFSGASSGYGFFAPGVGTHLRASFDVYDQKDNVRRTTLETRSSKESDLRVSNVINYFWDKVKDEKLRRAYSASWTGKVFGRFPDSRKIEIVLESYYLPTMAEYRAGTRGGWEPFYQAKFVRRSPGGQQ